MIRVSDAHKKLLSNYPRAVIHLRAQLLLGRLCLVFGAGLSKAFKLLDWPTLIETIAADPLVQGQQLLLRSSKESLPYKTDLLFQYFRGREANKGGPEKLGSPEFESATVAKWLNMCRTYLYQTAPSDFDGALKTHAYLLNYLPLIQESPITITYNFDDFIERALFATRDTKDNTLGYETATNPWMHCRRGNGAVYHLHGVLPVEPTESPRDQMVSSESANAKLFLGALEGDCSFLLGHMSDNTCLIIGSSLEDADLQALLVQSAQLNPGNPHYYVHFLQADEELSTADAEAIRKAHDGYPLHSGTPNRLWFGNQSALADSMIDR